ncbi:MAG: beta-ketoacyl synthase chain length factor [Dokdonella sp.]
MEGLIAYIDGIGWWSPGVPDWEHAARLLRGEDTATSDAAAKPAATVLPPTERRRAPESVRLACEVAGQACAMAAREPSTLACVFASAHGDTATTDALCATLADAPLETSPTRFHNSVHNAPAGYWTIAAQCRASSSAIAAGPGTFAAGLFEAAVEARADACAVLFAAYDIAACGALTDVVDNSAPFAVALIVSHARSPRTCASLHLRHEAQAAPATAPPARLAALAATNRIAAALPLFVALANGEPTSLRLRNGAHTMLAIEVRP